jgi:hypothetical protein
MRLALAMLALVAVVGCKSPRPYDGPEYPITEMLDPVTERTPTPRVVP